MAVVRTYDYHDDRGILVYQVCRTEPKGFFQRRPGADHKEWINGVPANIRTIFRLPQLVASPEGKTIYITEGEKDVLAIVDRGNYVATCNTCGAGKWPHDHDHYFENHPVIIIADKDEPGRKHARNVAEGIALAKAKSVKIIEVPGAGKDATDFLEAGGTIDELDALAAATPEYIPTPKPLELPDVPDILDTATPEATTAKAIIPRPAAKAAPAPSSPENQNLESTWQNILLKTMATQKGTGWMGKCPAHNDGKASLSLARGEDGRILMKCFAGCEFAEITKALQIESCSCFPPIAKRGTQPPEPPDAETLNYAQYYQPREWQINREAVPAIIATVNDFLCAELQQEPSIATLAASLWCATAIIGKRVAFTNRGNRYYCNLFMAILSPSGGNKSGTAGTVVDLLAEVLPNVGEISSTTLPAFLARYGDSIAGGATDRDQRFKEIKEKHSLNLSGTPLVIDEFRAFVMEMIPENEATKNSQKFCKLTENRLVDSDTVSRGLRLLFDPCVNMLGLSQTDPWNNEMRSAACQTGGIAARILPANPDMLKLVGWTCKPVTRYEAVEALQKLADYVSARSDVSQRIGVTFGGGDDPLKTVKDSAVAAYPYVSYFAESHPDEWSLLESKILMQSAKIGAVLAVADQAARAAPMDPFSTAPDTTVDAAPFMKWAWTFTGFCHVSNTYHCVRTTEQSVLQDRMIDAMKRHHGIASRRDLCRAMNLKSFEAQQIIDLMLQDGMIVPCKDGRRQVFQLRQETDTLDAFGVKDQKDCHTSSKVNDTFTDTFHKL